MYGRQDEDEYENMYFHKNFLLLFSYVGKFFKHNTNFPSNLMGSINNSIGGNQEQAL